VNDPFDLDRFVRAQVSDYPRALEEIKSGRKRSHWMWYVFPQLAGLGHSPMSEQYAVRSLAEARAYLQHPILGSRLTEICEALLNLKGRSALDVFGSPDDLKLNSSATLFAMVSAEGSVFHRVLDMYFGGSRDEKTSKLAG
jgi:uncharacterized protein (DUF1810 family)